MQFKPSILLISLLLFSCGGFAQTIGQPSFTGFIDTYHAMQSGDPHTFLSSRSRFRGKIKMQRGNSFFYTSFNAVNNNILPSQTGIKLLEAFFEYSARAWNIKAGRQIISWGIADGIRITDIIAPMDMTEFLARDYDDIKMPVDAMKIRWVKPNMNVEFICIPTHAFSIIPVEPDNPWSVFPGGDKPVLQTQKSNKPLNALSKSEFGVKFSFFLSGMDFSVSGLHSINRMPVYSKRFSPGADTLFIKANHNSMDMLGLDFSLPRGKFVFRAEGAWYLGEYHETKQIHGKSNLLQRNSLNWLLGVDWYPGGEWTLTAQYSQKRIHNYSDRLATTKNSVLSTMGATKKLFRSTLNLSTFSYVDIKNKSFFDRTSIDYALSDEVHCMMGYDWFSGSKGRFGPYRDNSEIWLKAKFSF